MEIRFSERSDSKVRAFGFNKNIGRCELTEYTNEKGVTIWVCGWGIGVFTDDGSVCMGEIDYFVHRN